ncbi:Rmd8p NDAI_0B06280 [Naumovozyma dairenensis CBS 421]|uniref:DUF155 domain-containing protein n=1 Tax=Naumovozyma dairenensis (strain ATCC 10597 / BCRC 20456 / CBS 421 / NBRC 0211 / NRRL Y-12639) TaxID=1071378 RepID=G0W798_NAUDC|nr:hypothetical protein NDAI_0B06280 [Naumovozyma dairenensis CBS 421]CCD23659.1 hypothetical protein NDAI_0B06280 [Naumovozyma dairenensis CBS 421]
MSTTNTEGNGRVRPMAKRSPSILVTDSRTSKNRLSAPFAGHAAGVLNRDEHRLPRNKSYRYNATNSNAELRGRHPSGGGGRFSDVSIDNILSDSSDVPSGRREERLSNSSLERSPLVTDRAHSRSQYQRKTINPLPSRTSKTSQRLVLIPEEGDNVSKDDIRGNISSGLDRKRHTPIPKYNDEYYQPEPRTHKLARITAYNVAEGFNLSLLSKFLQDTHEVSPRMYDECLYVAYTLPLLPGKDGFRIKSNVSKKFVGGMTLIDKLIDTSEQRDHHYEYFSGVETLEDANNNYELNPTSPPMENVENQPIPTHLPVPPTNPDAFNPSEPQFFAEETPIEQKLREQNERLNIVPTNIAMNSSQVAANGDQHAEIFVFHYGVIVFWNFTEVQEKNLLGDITFSYYRRNLVIRPLDEQDIETEQFHFGYDKNTERPRIFNDIVTLRSGDHMIELTLSHAIAQSSKLSRFESRISPLLTSITKLPKRLALYGTLGLKRSQLLKKSGKLFKLRVDVNLSSSILDSPEFFWSTEPSLSPLYIAMREYLEIDQRVQVLNDRCIVFLEFFDICVDSVAEKNIARFTWWFVIAIIVGLFFSLSEIFVRYIIIHNR